jgi:hypothetical protein
MTGAVLAMEHRVGCGALAARDRLLEVEDGVMRVPFLVKGALRIPARIERSRIEAVFSELDAGAGPSDAMKTFARIDGLQVLREPVVDRGTLRPTGDHVYTVTPSFRAEDLIERDLDALEELYDLPFDGVLDYVDGLREALLADHGFFDDVARATLPMAQQPDAWQHAAFAAIPILLDRAELRRGVDAELEAFGIPGSRYLDGFQPLPIDGVQPMPVNVFAEAIYGGSGHAFERRRPEMRALPTRQLHITAGNSPHIPFMSALRAIATKSPAVIKSPYGALLPGALLALAAACRPDHPITRHLSIVYWPGGDESVERSFFAPLAFDRIVVWGAPGAVQSVKERAQHTKVLTFDPRYGASLIGREAGADLDRVAQKVVCDALVANQKACIATQVVYAEGDERQIGALAEAIRRALAAFDAEIPNLIAPAQVGEVKRLMKGVFLDAEWYTNQRDGAFSSAVVVAPNEFKVGALPMCRFLVLRPVEDLSDALAYFHPGVATVSVHPEHRRRDLATRIGARGVSNIVPLGQSGSGFSGQSHDGMRVLAELVDWKNG